jgi:hypothetical protein
MLAAVGVENGKRLTHFHTSLRPQTAEALLQQGLYLAPHEYFGAGFDHD